MRQLKVLRAALAATAVTASLLYPGVTAAGTPVPAGTTGGAAAPSTAPAFLSDVPASAAGLSPQSLAVQPDATGGLAAGFSDVTVFSGLTNPSKIQFAADGRVFVAEKSGLILVYSSLSATTPTVYADLTSEVDDYWDRGLLGFALSPNFVNDHTFYVQYGWDHNPVHDFNPSAPAQWNDACPSPPGPTSDGCPILGHISKFTTVPGATPLGPTNETVLVTGWCQQFPSHSNDDLWVGPDGDLYSTAGEGASFDGPDYGQLGGSSGSPTPANPCGDPTMAAGNADTLPNAQGGALRAQSVRRATGQPVDLNGALLRIDPNTGYGVPGNPFYSGNGDDNASRILAYGLRNPFRFTFQPGKNVVWIGDVGYSTTEEIDRLPLPTTSSNDNFGWPCMEGNQSQTYYVSLTLNACSTMGSSVAPVFTYNHGSPVANETSCLTANGSSISGMAFYTGTSYPAAYQGALFFGDHSRGCIWAMLPDANGNPNPNNVKIVVDGGAAQPVDIEVGPGGDLFYSRYDTGEIHRLTYGTPQAVIKANQTSGAAPLAVNFDGTASSSPIGATPLTYSWSFGGGSCSSTTTSKPTCTFPAGTYQVRLTVTDTNGATNTSPVTTITSGGSPPTAFIDTVDGNPPPAQPTLDGSGNPPAVKPGTVPAFYQVGDTITFTGHATDPQQGTLPAADLTWDVRIFHCPSDCHTHEVQTIVGAGGSVAAPDHPYPSLLWVQLTATDAQGLTSTSSVYLYPNISTFTIATVPAGLAVSAGTTTGTGPYQASFLRNGSVTLSAPLTQSLGATSYTFTGWSDGGAASHNVTASTATATYTATYVASGTITYLSDMTPTTAINGWGPYEKDMSNGEQAAGDGHTISIRGATYAKGLGVHALSDLRYTLPASCTSFNAVVGVDDEVNGLGSVDFQVYLDGAATTSYDSGVVTGTSAAKTVAVNLIGHTQLRLVVTDGGDGNAYDHSDWADAKITCGSGGGDTTPPTVTTTVPASGATGVATGSPVSATFSEALAAATVTTSTVQLVPQGSSTALGATVSYNAGTFQATLTPTAALADSTTYTASLQGGPGGLTDVAGNALASTVSWSFTTAAAGAQTITYLSDMTPTTAINGWGPYEKDMSNGEQAAGDGHTISIRGATYAKGLGVHALSDLRYTLPASCTSFNAVVGVDDEVNGLGSVDFQVYLDGAATTSYDSGVVTGTSAAKTVAVNLIGHTQLRLVVTDGGDGNAYDHSDWADAKITCGSGGGGGSTITYLSDMTPTTAINGWGPYEKDMSNGEQAAGDGHTISIRGATYAKGLGVHALSDLRYTLPASCTSFNAVVGVDDEVNGLGSVDFQVYLDGAATTSYDSGVVTGTSAAKTVAVNLTGHTQLRLVVTDGGDGNAYDHSDWADAKITCGS